MVVFLFILTGAIILINTTSEAKLLPLKENDRGVVGGPKLLASASQTNSSLSNTFALSANQNSLDSNNSLNSLNNSSIYYLTDYNSLQNPNAVLTGIKSAANGILLYKVQKGDTLLSIASDFGISLDTIRWANNLKSDHLTPGQELIILPVSGVLHEVKPGDTLESIAQLYSAPMEKIIAFNNLSGSNLVPGAKIIVPDGRIPKTYKVFAAKSALPDYPYYYVLPTTGFNWGILHNVNAVDIANNCDTPVVAAAEGLVELTAHDNSYGNYIKIQHPNNTETLYAHLNKIVVNAGDYVMQGQLIGYMGNTGYVIGNPGCHLHFEVHGAKNPFAK